MIENLPNEIWKNVEGYESYYQISNLGRVKSLERIVNSSKRSCFKVKEKIITNVIKTTGYYYVTLCKDKYNYYTLHRLIAKAFISNPNNYPCVNHIDGNKLNNSVDNLEWCTYAHNSKHAHKIGLNNIPHKYGCETYNAIFTKEQVQFIRKQDISKFGTKSKLAKQFNVSQGAIGNLINYKTYKNEQI